MLLFAQFGKGLSHGQLHLARLLLYASENDVQQEQ